MSGGTTYNAQTLIWDAWGRLAKISQRNTGASDFDSTNVYDGLGRRVQTTWQPMNNGVNSGTASVLSYYYDPQVEFLQLGLNDNGPHTWKVYGPDRSGVYGGAQGEGGLENSVDETGGFGYVSLNNYFGDALGASYVPNLVNPSYFNTYSYGSVLGGYGYEPGSLIYGLSPQWRGEYLDWSGFIYKGARYYDYQAGKFLSADPLGHDASMSLYDYCNGDPVNGLDPDGRDGLMPEIFAGPGLDIYAKNPQAMIKVEALTAGIGVGILSYGTLTPYVAGLGLTGITQTAATVGVGTFSVGVGNSTYQLTNMAFGQQQQFSLGQTGIAMGGTAVALSGGAYFDSLYAGDSLSRNAFLTWNFALGSGTSIATNATTQWMNTGEVKPGELIVPGVLGGTFGLGSGGASLLKESINEHAQEIESEAGSLNMYLNSPAEMDVANISAEQVAFTAAGQTVALGVGDQVVSPFVEGALDETISKQLGFEEKPSGGESPSGDALSSQEATWK